MNKFQVSTGFNQIAVRVHDEDGDHEAIRNVWTAIASTQDGRQWEFNKDRSTFSEGSNPDTAPADWFEMPPIYGSDAWDEEAEYDLACFEADAFSEERPRWF